YFLASSRRCRGPRLSVSRRPQGRGGGGSAGAAGGRPRLGGRRGARRAVGPLRPQPPGAPASGFGSYFCYDNPAALQTQIKGDMQVNTTKFMLLYAWYSWPNVVTEYLEYDGAPLFLDALFALDRWFLLWVEYLMLFG
ncbi:hypothetical protein HPG69_007780, partial [Diceros bicornis minor]